MKAVIFNSGLGKRMGKYTENGHKSMVRIASGESIFERQLRMLSEAGITDFLVTVGPFNEQLINAAKAPHLAHCRFTFVENPVYDTTNYIYSMYLAREHFDDDVIMLHGDLVFDRSLLEDVLACPQPDIGTVSFDRPQPEKDFKARIKDGRIQEVSVKIFDDDCYAFQPMYKLSRATVGKWIKKVEEFVDAGNTGVYAENAMNEIFPSLDVRAFSYDGRFVDEIDCPEDLERVSAEIRRFDFAQQRVLREDVCAAVSGVLEKHRAKRPFVVCDAAFDKLPVSESLRGVVGDAVYFSDFSPNPKYDDIVKGVELYHSSACDIIISVGGGSAIDTAKAIKLFAGDPAGSEYISNAHVFNPTVHLAIPTTAGTGSESTRYAVIYYKGEKQSLTGDNLLPDYAVLDHSLLATLPLGQKKATFLDALCQAIESMWSVNSDDVSKAYAREAIMLLRDSCADYLNGVPGAAGSISAGANLAGKAINITQTTAAHAMSYKITSLFGIPHGAAVALCLPHVWKLIKDNTARCNDVRGEEHLNGVLAELDELIGGLDGFLRIYGDMDMPAVPVCSAEQLDVLTASVNPVRLGNNPVTPTGDELRAMYRQIFAC
ncbi:MAG: iron-containing alcohol dehydrogenase [Ruminococcaceae bacterium]|nr:iron-containing alcohol dehydrogenase [Oscillospiraceae bacterium]